MANHEITRMVLRTYSDTGQRRVIIEWDDGRSETTCDAEEATKSAHMQALIARGHAKGLRLVIQKW
jgi:hypothetical protein